jgi:hypothetical protein
MAAHKKSKSSLYLLVLLVLVAVLIIVFYAKSNLGGTSSPTPTAKPATSENVATPVSAISGPIGRNLLSIKSGPKTGEVMLSWTRYYSDYGTYSIVYRIDPGKYEFSVLNAGSSSSKSNTYSYVVGSLKPGTKYYFAIEILQTNSKSVYVTPEVSIVAP